jgi:dipeptidyl aminopeptidase/acylaminoacyl peptidase
MNKFSLYLSAILFFLAGNGFGQNAGRDTLSVDRFLLAGPQEVQMPAFSNQPNMTGKTFQPAMLLQFSQKKVQAPEAGKIYLKTDNGEIKWVKADNRTLLNTSIDKPYALYRQAFYLQARRFVKLTLTSAGTNPFEVLVKGQKKISNNRFQKSPVTKNTVLKLIPGKYLITVKQLVQKGEKAEPVRITFQYNKEFEPAPIVLSLSDEQFMDIPHLLLGQRLTSVHISDDGKLALLQYAETHPPKGKTEHWFEVKDIASGHLLFSSRYSDRSQPAWVPGEHALSYLVKESGTTVLMLYRLNTRSEKRLMKTPERFSGYQWSPTGRFIVYSVMEKYKKNNNGVFKLEGMPDRWPWYRQRSQLYLFRVADKSKQQLTYGYLANNLEDISPDGKKILFSQSFPDYAHRPFTRQILMQMNLKSGKIDTIWNTSFGGSAIYSPDGKQLLVTGSPAMFNGAGVHLKKAKIPNDFDIQGYIYTLATKKVQPITKNFNPSIEQAWWNPVNGKIYFRTTDRTYVDLWEYNPKNKTFIALPMHTDVATQADFARKAPALAYCGSNISYPATGWYVNLKTGRQKEIADPEKKFFAHIKFGKTEDWNFKNKKGLTIEGRIYYPPDYDPNKKYPLLVYYYGGTVPTTRDFGGRYPKNLFAAMGYIVYDLQPSGCTGYGQDFSALHVNGWGKENARDIIEGTKKFIAAHPQVNPKAVACMGASYGGYMTMWLQTQTDIFTTAIAHAGISDITSYWGQGYWGYLYSATASANSFPWNNKKLYVDHSPLFNAEKIHTPMLLLHGTADTNVPTGESIQLYTALKLLGRPVELVEIKGQNHHIIDYNKRILWQKTIFAWLAKYLKNQPQWWNDMYPHKDL